MNRNVLLLIHPELSFPLVFLPPILFDCFPLTYM